MSRYIIQFADRTTKRVDEQEAKAVIAALAERKPIVLRGAYFSSNHVVAVKPITKDWFDGDTVQLEQRNTLALNPGNDSDESPPPLH